MERVWLDVELRLIRSLSRFPLSWIRRLERIVPQTEIQSDALVIPGIIHEPGMLHRVVVLRERRIHRLDVHWYCEIVRPDRVDVAVVAGEARVRRIFPKRAITDLHSVVSKVAARRVERVNDVDVLVVAAVDG